MTERVLFKNFAGNDSSDVHGRIQVGRWSGRAGRIAQSSASDPPTEDGQTTADACYFRFQPVAGHLHQMLLHVGRQSLLLPFNGNSGRVQHQRRYYRQKERRETGGCLERFFLLPFYWLMLILDGYCFSFFANSSVFYRLLHDWFEFEDGVPGRKGWSTVELRCGGKVLHRVHNAGTDGRGWAHVVHVGARR